MPLPDDTLPGIEPAVPAPEPAPLPAPAQPANPFAQDVQAQAIAQPPADDFAQDVAEQSRQNLAPLAGSLYAASKMDPARHATVLEYADKAGLDPQLVDRNLEYFRGLTKYDDAQQGADMATVLKQSPKLALWLQNRDNAAIAQDDLPTLRRLSEALTQVNPPADDREALPWLRAAGATIRKTLGHLSQEVAAIPAMAQQSLREIAGIQGDPWSYTPLGIVYSAEDQIRAEERAWATYQESTAQKLALPVVGLLANPTNALPLAAGATAAKSAIAIAQVAKDAMALRAAAGAMSIQSGTQALEESLRARQQAGEAEGKVLLPTMGDASHAALQASLAYLMGTAGGLTGTLRSLRSVTPTFGEAIADVGKQALVGGAQGSLGQDLTDLFHGRMPTTGEQVMAFAAGAAGGGALAALNVPSAFAHVAGARMIDRVLAAHEAVDGVANLARAAVALANSKTQERSAGRMQDLMASIVQASGQEASGKVYAQGDAWDAYWHEAGMDPEQVATAMTGDPKAYAQAVATGGAIAIPQETFLSKLAGTEHFAKLLNKVSLGPGKPTLEQANETFKGFSADLQKLHESIRSEVQTGAGIADPSGQAVFDDIYAQRIKSGAAPEVAKVDATLWQHAMAGIARQYNETVKESGAAPVNASDLFRSMRLRIHREVPEVLRGTNATQNIEPLLNELRQARGSQEGVSNKVRGPTYLPEHLRQFDEALRQAGIDIADHPTNETIYQTVRDRLAEHATTVLGDPAMAAQPVTFEQAEPHPGERTPPHVEEDTVQPQDIVNPIDRTASPEDKVRQLEALTEENKPIVADIMAEIDKALGTESKSSVKEPAKILSKASRPEIVAEKPWHDVEHIRDSFRFKTPIKTLGDVARIFQILKQHGVSLVKVDTAKMLAPKKWGWRFAGFDLRMPNGQLVEFYCPPHTLDAHDVKHPNHLLFEKWRNATQEHIDANQAEMARDVAESRARYDAAFAQFLERSGMDEKALVASWTKVVDSLGETSSNLSINSDAVGASEGPNRQTPLTRRAEGMPALMTETTPDLGSRETIGGVDTAGTSNDGSVAPGALGPNGEPRGTSPDAGQTFHQAAFHGSPHEFDRFTTRKMGTGEGQQAFGWGLYFAGKKDVAEFYRNKLSPTTFTFDGKPITRESVHADTRAKTLPGELIGIVSAIHSAHSIEGAQQFLDQAAEGDTKSAKSWKPIAAFLRENRSRFGVESKGKVYTVEIPEDDELLNWDKPLRAQPEAVRTAVEKVLKANPEAQRLLDVSSPGSFQAKDVDHFMGEGIYRVLAQALGSDAAASRALAKAGVPGLRYLDQQSRASGDGTTNYVLFRGTDARVTGYEQANGRNVRGSITFGDLATTIRLFQSENLSTFSHESAHAWLHAFGSLADRPDAPPSMKAEWAKVLDWMGVTSSAEIGTKQHEQWAEAWEHYLREGKAPSAELRPAFARIKAWFLQVYANVKEIYRTSGGKVALNDEMRGVFDRMLASRDEIAAANDHDAADPLFMTAAQAGMSEAAFASYQKRAMAERQQRQDLLERKLVSGFLKEQTRLYQDERVKVRGAVASEMNGRRDLAAVALLQRGRLPDGTPVTGPEMKLDRADLVKAFGEENLEHLPGAGGKRANQKNRGPMVYAKDGGLPIDVVAEALGYQSGSELFHDLVNAPDLKTTIEAATDQRMAERYPDPLKDGTIGQKVIEATHEKERRAEVLDDEAQALAAKVRTSATPRQVIKAMAAETIGRMAPRDINPNVYRLAEAKAGREAFDAVAKDQYEKALVAKQRQQINHELCRAAVEAKAEAGKIRDHARDLQRPAARERIGKAGGWEWTVRRPDGQVMKLPTEEAARSMAEQTDGATWARTSGYLESIDRISRTVDWERMSQAAMAQQDLPLFKALAEFQQQKNAMGIPIDLPPEVMARGKQNWQKLTMEELRGVDDALRNIEHAARSLTKTLKDQRAKDFADLQQKVGASVVAHSNGPREQRLGTTLFSKISRGASKVLNLNTRVTDLIFRMNGHREGGDLFWNWQHPLNEAGDREGEMEAKATVEQNRLLTEWGKTGPLKSIGLNRPEYIPEIKQSLNKLAQIMFALNYGNAGNRERLLEGMKIDETQAQAVLDKLDAGDWKFVNGIIKHINSFWPEIAALEQRVHGVAPEKVEAAPFMTKHGEQPGGYFPIKYDNRLTPAPSHESPESEAEGLLAGRGPGYAMTSHGHTEMRTGSQGRPLDLDFGVIAGHLNRVIKDLAQRETLMSLNRLLRSEGFQRPVVEHWGKQSWDLFEQQLRAVARGPAIDETGIGQVLGFMRQGANAARRSFAIAYAVKQLPGMMAAIPRLGAANVLRALVPAFSPQAHLWAEEHSTSLRLRGQMRNKSLSEPAKRTSSFAARGPLESIAYLFASKAWKVVDTHAWYAGFYKAQAMAEVGTDVHKAVSIADQIMNDTQGGFLPKDMPQMLRGGELAKVFTNNMSWANANFNLMANSLYRFADQRTPQAAAQMASDMALYLIVAPAIYLGVSDLLDGTIEDWTDPDKVRKKVAHEAAYTALGSIPVLREMSNALTEGRRAELPQGASGLGEVINLAAALNKDLTSDDGSGVSRGTARGALKVAGVITHFPAWQVLRMLDGWTYAEEHGKNPILPTLLGQTGK